MILLSYPPHIISVPFFTTADRRTDDRIDRRESSSSSGSIFVTFVDLRRSGLAAMGFSEPPEGIVSLLESAIGTVV